MEEEQRIMSISQELRDFQQDMEVRIGAVFQQVALLSQQVAGVQRAQTSYHADDLMLLNEVLAAIKVQGAYPANILVLLNEILAAIKALTAPAKIFLDVEDATTRSQPAPSHKGP